MRMLTVGARLRRPDRQPAGPLHVVDAERQPLVEMEPVGALRDEVAARGPQHPQGGAGDHEEHGEHERVAGQRDGDHAGDRRRGS